MRGPSVRLSHEQTHRPYAVRIRRRVIRAGITLTSDEQKRIAEDTIADVDASGLWPAKAVTEVVPAGAFWEAEREHQDYLEKNPGGYTCHFVRPHWKLPKRADKVAKQA